MDIKSRPRIPIPDEDPYSIAGNGSSGSSVFTGHDSTSARGKLISENHQFSYGRNEKPPKLPPRENVYPHEIPKVIFNARQNII